MGPNFVSDIAAKWVIDKQLRDAKLLLSGTEKVPQRTFATKISPNFRVNFLARFASKTLVLMGNDR